MSYIDLFKHRYLCNIVGLPLYLAQEDIDGEEFSCLEGTLILGGGSGEHPACTFLSVDAAVSDYLFMNDIIDWEEALIEDGRNMIMHGWSVDNYVQFNQRAVTHGFDPEKHGSVESMVSMEVGKYILENYPNMIKNPAFKKVQ